MTSQSYPVRFVNSNIDEIIKQLYHHGNSKIRKLKGIVTSRMGTVCKLDQYFKSEIESLFSNADVSINEVVWHFL